MIDQDKLDAVLKYGSICFNKNSTTNDCAGCPYQEDEDFEHAPEDAIHQCDNLLAYDAIELLKQLVEENNDLLNQLQDKKLVEEASDEKCAEYRKLYFDLLTKTTAARMEK